MPQVEFFFDVISPYSYLAYYELQKIAARQQAEILWRPILLGAVFKATGNSSPMVVPAKAQHATLDLKRWAAHYQIPFRMNKAFPFNSMELMRIAVGLQMHDPAIFLHYLAVIFKAMFGEPRNLSDLAEVEVVLKDAGINPTFALSLAEDEAVKSKLKMDTQAAIERGVFGAPAFFVGKNLYWGQDRLLFVEQALRACP